jgi:hypothetical protein
MAKLRGSTDSLVQGKRMFDEDEIQGSGGVGKGGISP